MHAIATCEVIFSLLVPCVLTAELDLIDCGVDNADEVEVGYDINPKTYPWLGILYYANHGDAGESRAVTSVMLIQREFVIGAAADIGRMPKHNFRRNTFVLIGEDWTGESLSVRNYVLHPEYSETHNTLALVQLTDPIRDNEIRPLCPPPDILRNPTFYVMRYKNDYNKLKKEVIPVSHVPGNLCKQFYQSANLYAKKLRPPHAACAVSLRSNAPCVWEAGAALVARDVWGRWQLLGVGVRGPGCGAPSRFLDMVSYFDWLKESLAKFQRVTISKITKQQYVLRTAGYNAFQRFGKCDEEEKINLIYRESIVIRTDNSQYQFLTYNMTIYEDVEFTCLTLELVNASAVSELRIRHMCPREPFGPACYQYKGSSFDISVYLIFSDKCTFEMNAWGWKKDMRLLDIMEWKWEEATYYEDFSLTKVEYRGTADETLYGYEPLDESMWVPEYDLWTTTEYDNRTTVTTYVPEFDEGTGGSPKHAMTEPTAPSNQPSTEPNVDVTDEPDSEFIIGINW